MEYHTGRLIVTVIFLMFAVSALANGFWPSAVFWGILTYLVGHPFVRGGKLDLHYDTPGRTTVVREEIFYPPPTAPPPTAPRTGL